jgi:hypothetical protein
MNEIYRLHEKATALLELCRLEEERIIMLNDEVNKYKKDFIALATKKKSDLDICERALKRLKYSYMKVLMQIAEL